MALRTPVLERCAAVALGVLLLVACGRTDDPAAEVAASPAAEPLVVATTSPLGSWLVDAIGGGDVRLSEAIPRDVDHHSFQPTAEQVVALGEADLVVLQGAGYEPWREGASLPESRVVDLSAGLSLIPVEGRTHSHGAEGEHSHAGADPATWMDPSLVLEQARQVLAALEAASPERAPAFLERAHALETELERIAARVAEIGESLRAGDVAVAGDAGRYAYLARALGVELLELPDEPDSHDLGHLRRAVGGRLLVVLRPAPPDDALRGRLEGAAWVELAAPLPAVGPAGIEYVEPLEAGLDRLSSAVTSTSGAA
jgi:zinc transport system substrate-binding protein